jgi:hypothetical protein
VTSLRMTAVALSLLGSSFAIGEASAAMPVNGLGPAENQISANVQDVRWVCGPYRCWWRPGWGPGPYWRGPYWGYAPGWHGWGWRRWHRW